MILEEQSVCPGELTPALPLSSSSFIPAQDCPSTVGCNSQVSQLDIIVQTLKWLHQPGTWAFNVMPSQPHLPSLPLIPSNHTELLPPVHQDLLLMFCTGYFFGLLKYLCIRQRCSLKLWLSEKVHMPGAGIWLSLLCAWVLLTDLIKALHTMWGFKGCSDGKESHMPM